MPNNAVHVPGDVWAGVTREQVEEVVDDLLWLAGRNGEAYREASSVAAALRRLALYLPSEAPQEAVQPPCDVEPGE